MDKTIEFLKTGSKNFLMAMTFGGYHLYVTQRENDIIREQLKADRETRALERELEAQKRALERELEAQKRTREYEQRMQELNRRRWWF